uniref:C2H2-type domain-containing protein n=1 Tax=Petromyzon marinus TaxID=7757 RepID=S4R7M6_PETMA
ERPYVCEDCGKGFGSPAHLRQHRRGHAGAKRYRCGRCAKEFRCEESLQQHLLLHT